MNHALQLLSVALVLLLSATAPVLSAGTLVVTPDHADGVYSADETVTWKVAWEGDDPPPAQVTYVVRRGGLTEIDRGTLDLSEAPATIKATFDGPGTIRLDVLADPEAAEPVKGLGGVIADPVKIKPVTPRPDDFDAFWQAQIDRLSEIDPNPRLEAVEVDTPDVEYSKIWMDGIDDSTIHGQIARPIEGDKFPAVLIVQWAGVYPLQQGWVTSRASEGWLALNILAHDLPIDEPRAFYREQSDGPLRNYPAIGNDDRLTSYFLRMYLSCYRAAEYLANHPNWDGKTLVVMGGSQGGQQALVTAALHPKITAAMAGVPAGCDMLGPTAGRRGGYPQWYYQVGDRNPARVHETSRYFDVINFASKIDCPVLVSAGLMDDTCPPAGICAAVNEIDAPVELILMPQAEHTERNGSHDAYDERLWGAWMPALREGKAPPVEELGK